MLHNRAKTVTRASHNTPEAAENTEMFITHGFFPMVDRVLETPNELCHGHPGDRMLEVEEDTSLDTGKF